MKKEEKQKIILSPDQILKHMKQETVMVPIPEWGEDVFVECQIPGPDEILSLFELANNDPKILKESLFKACLKGFSALQLEALKKTNGVKYMQLFDAVNKHKSMIQSAVNPEILGERKTS